MGQHTSIHHQRTRARRFFVFTLISLLLPFSLSHSQPPADVELADEQVLRRGNGTEPHSLDPQIGEGVPSSHIKRDLFEGLVSEAPDGKLIPGAAERWDISEDGREYIFHLRPEARWSNGEPVTAEDFAYTFRRLVDPATGSNYSIILDPIVNARAIVSGDQPPDTLGVEVIDRHQLKVTLREPTPYFIGILAHATTYPVYRPAVEKFGNRHTRADNLVSNGAYRLAEWEVNSHIKVVRNEHYWDNANTTLDTVYFYATEDLSSEILRYRAGELDITYELPVSQIEQLKETIPEQVHIAPYLGVYYYGLNISQPPLKNAPKSLRQALSMSIDREIITDKLMGDGSIPAYSWVPPGTLNYEGVSYDWEQLSRTERLAKAKQLYREAGYSEDNPLRIEIRYNTHENHKKIALAVSAMWRENLGVITTIINQEWKVFLDVVNQQRITQAFRAGWIGDYNDAYSFLELGLSYNAKNNTGWESAEFDQLLEQSATAQSPEQRMEFLQQAEKTLLEEYPYIPIYHYTSKRLIKPYVGGFQSNIMDHYASKYLYIKAH